MLKAGYMFQEKDRIFDSRPFFINTASNALKLLPSNAIFNTENFGEGNDKLQFNEIAGNAFRYMANNILNAVYLQMDNAVSEKFRAVWGVRFESFDQLVGSKDVNDPRHVRSIVNDFLPGVNLTFKPEASTNIRLAASQTVVRPEFRELSPFAFYDFELGAQVVGNKSAKRTKVSNIDLRYEIYPRGGELFTVGVFYKYFDKPNFVALGKSLKALLRQCLDLGVKQLAIPQIGCGLEGLKWTAVSQLINNIFRQHCIQIDVYCPANSAAIGSSASANLYSEQTNELTLAEICDLSNQSPFRTVKESEDAIELRKPLFPNEPESFFEGTAVFEYLDEELKIFGESDLAQLNNIRKAYEEIERPFARNVPDKAKPFNHSLMTL
jgi:hypothetical protein